jgi:UDP-GlcNAc:undecaprenyl-phosphate/decaprenyl-phosphate GlcNAc-1-phosphate transferase
VTTAATAAISFGVAATASLAATPAAMRIARRTDFLDYPRQYRKHAKPTPFLGGAAVLVAFLIASLLVAGASGRLLVPLGCALALWLIGTIDDRVAVAPQWRVLAEAGAGAVLFAAGLGWDTSLQATGDCILTMATVVIAVNAFNLMDNLDGACASVTAVAAAGVGILAAIKGDVALAGLGFGLSGACAGFLPWNLAGPAKIFLGDGGSMPIGFLVVALVMATAWHSGNGDPAVLTGALLAGLPIFDSTLVSYSRMRRGVTLVTGGRDHLTHRLLPVLGSPRAVAAVLALLQIGLCALAIAGWQLGSTAMAWIGLAVFVAGVAAIVMLDGPRWRLAGLAVGQDDQLAVPRHHTASVEEA